MDDLNNSDALQKKAHRYSAGQAAIDQEIFSAILKGNREAFQKIINEYSEADVLKTLLTTIFDNMDETVKHEEEVMQDATELLGPSVFHLNALHVACLLGEEDLSLDILDFFKKATDEMEAKKLLLEFLGRQWGNGNTILHLASFYGMCDLVKKLIECGANPNKKNERNYKPVDCADDPETRNMFNLVETNFSRPLIKTHSNSFSRLNSVKDDLKRSFSKSSSLSEIPATRSFDSDISSLHKRGASHGEMLEKEGKKSLRLKFDTDSTLLYMCQFGDPSDPMQFHDFKKLAEENGHLKDIRSPQQSMSLLQVACSFNQTDIVAYLLKLGFPVNLIDREGWTALHCACAEGNLDIIKMLLRCQKNTSDSVSDDELFAVDDGPIYMYSITHDGEEPEDVAAENREDEIIEILKGKFEQWIDFVAAREKYPQKKRLVVKLEAGAEVEEDSEEETVVPYLKSMPFDSQTAKKSEENKRTNRVDFNDMTLNLKARGMTIKTNRSNILSEESPKLSPINHKPAKLSPSASDTVENVQKETQNLSQLATPLMDPTEMEKAITPTVVQELKLTHSIEHSPIRQGNDEFETTTRHVEELVKCLPDGNASLDSNSGFNEDANVPSPKPSELPSKESSLSTRPPLTKLISPSSLRSEVSSSPPSTGECTPLSPSHSTFESRIPRPNASRLARNNSKREARADPSVAKISSPIIKDEKISLLSSIKPEADKPEKEESPKVAEQIVLDSPSSKMLTPELPIPQNPENALSVAVNVVERREVCAKESPIITESLNIDKDRKIVNEKEPSKLERQDTNDKSEATDSTNIPINASNKNNDAITMRFPASKISSPSMHSPMDLYKKIPSISSNKSIEKLNASAQNLITKQGSSNSLEQSKFMVKGESGFASKEFNKPTTPILSRAKTSVERLTRSNNEPALGNNNPTESNSSEDVKSLDIESKVSKLRALFERK